MKKFVYLHLLGLTASAPLLGLMLMERIDGLTGVKTDIAMAILLLAIVMHIRALRRLLSKSPSTEN